MSGLKKIPFFGLDRQYSSLKNELLDAVDSVYKTGHVLDGNYTRLFEQKIQELTNRKYAVAVTSCSLALLISFLYFSKKTQKRKNVLLPALSFIATANAPILGSWKTHFIDVDNHGLMDLTKLDISKIDIISYVNLFGNILDYDKLQLIADFLYSDKIIIEDAAQSFGATYKGIPSGKLGAVSCLSFDPTKNLPNYGSGGMVLTDDYNLYLFALGYRNNGKTATATYPSPGSNCKMSEADCAQMLIKLKYFNFWQKRRKEIADYYFEQLANYVDCPFANEHVTHAWHKYVIQTPFQLSLKQFLTSRKIETKIHYSESLITHSFIRSTKGSKHFQKAMELSHTCLSLPIYPELLDSEVEKIVSEIKAFFH